MRILSKNISISKALIDRLRELFPDTLPMNTAITLEEIRYLQGQQSVLQKLDELYDEIYED
jgi:hypothetical protein